MAIVNSVEKSKRKNLKLNPKETYCECAFFHDRSGDKYFQIESFGSKDREIKNKQSQVLQFDMNQLKALINIVRAEVERIENV